MSSGYPVYEYVSSNTAILTGVSAFINVRLLKQLEWDNRFTYIYTFLPNATDSTDHLPWIPAPHLHTDLILHLGIFHNAYIKAGLAKYWEQNNVYSALHTELPSAGYWLFHAGIGTDFVQRASGRVICSFYLNCTNLTNVAYADHLNLAQYFYSLNGNLVTVTRQRQGVFDMGRDISLKVVFPFGGKYR
jgi:iron complex outermembrane receptor protein